MRFEEGRCRRAKRPRPLCGCSMKAIRAGSSGRGVHPGGRATQIAAGRDPGLAGREGEGGAQPLARAVGGLALPAASISPAAPPLPPAAAAAPTQGRLSLRQATPAEDRHRRVVLRRRVAASGMLPHQLAGHFTLGKQAVLTAVAYEVMRKDFSALSWREVGRRAGVCRCLVKRTIRKARRLGLLSVEERRAGWLNQASVVRILDPLWCRWLERRKAAEGRKTYGGINGPALANSSRFRTGIEPLIQLRTPAQSPSLGFRRAQDARSG
jgi:hypothetical protein